MFTITDVAVVKAKEVLKAEGKDDWGLRIFVSEGCGCAPSYGMDLDEKPKDGDEVIEKDGLKVFADKEAIDKLGGMEVDFVDDGQNQGFVIKGKDTGEAPSCGSGGCGSGGCG